MCLNGICSRSVLLEIYEKFLREKGSRRLSFPKINSRLHNSRTVTVATAYSEGVLVNLSGRSLLVSVGTSSDPGYSSYSNNCNLFVHQMLKHRFNEDPLELLAQETLKRIEGFRGSIIFGDCHGFLQLFEREGSLFCYSIADILSKENKILVEEVSAKQTPCPLYSKKIVRPMYEVLRGTLIKEF